MDDTRQILAARLRRRVENDETSASARGEAGQKYKQNMKKKKQLNVKIIK